MGFLVIGAVVLLTISIGVYLTTRGLPPVGPPLPPSGTCVVDSDCPHPETCVMSACADPALPALLSAAQAAASAFYNVYQSVVTKFTTSQSIDSYLGHANLLISSAIYNNFSTNSILDQLQNQLVKDITAGLASFTTFSQQALVSPSGCDPMQTSCPGYYTEIMDLTPNLNTGTLTWTVADMASNVLLNLPSITSAFPSVAADLSNLVVAVTNSAHDQGRDLGPITTLNVATITADIAELNGLAATLTSLATAVKQSGAALYSHYING